MAGSGTRRGGTSRPAGGKAGTTPYRVPDTFKRRVNAERTYRAADRYWGRMNVGLPGPTTKAYARQTSARSYMFRERMADRLRRNFDGFTGKGR